MRIYLNNFFELFIFPLDEFVKQSFIRKEISVNADIEFPNSRNEYGSIQIYFLVNLKEFPDFNHCIDMSVLLTQ